MTHHVFGYAAHQQPVEAAAAVGTDNDKVGARLFAASDDAVRG
jgi:hypothetical protein